MPTTLVEKPVAQVVLRALKAVADASRGLHDSERDLLEAAARMLHTDEPLSALEAIEPDEAGATLTNERDRTRLVEAMLLMAMMDQEVDKPELAVIDRFAKAWSIDEPRIKNLHQYVDGHRMRMKLDVLRRSQYEVTGPRSQDRGLRLNR
jgi:hypothetical protein